MACHGDADEGCDGVFQLLQPGLPLRLPVLPASDRGPGQKWRSRGSSSGRGLKHQGWSALEEQKQAGTEFPQSRGVLRIAAV